WGQPSWVIPPTVRLSVLTASPPSIRHESTGTPSTSTAQVPHSPSSQPCLVPVRPMSSRKTSNKVLLISVATSLVSPLTRSCNSVLVSLPSAPFFLLSLILVLSARDAFTLDGLCAFARNSSYPTLFLSRQDAKSAKRHSYSSFRSHPP